VERERLSLGPWQARRILQFLQHQVVKRDDPRSLGEAPDGPELGEFRNDGMGHPQEIYRQLFTKKRNEMAETDGRGWRRD